MSGGMTNCGETKTEQSHADEAKSFLAFSHCVPLFLPRGTDSRGDEQASARLSQQGTTTTIHSVHTQYRITVKEDNRGPISQPHIASTTGSLNYLPSRSETGGPSSKQQGQMLKQL